MVNPVAPFYEYYLSIVTYALPAPFMSFLGMTFFVFIFLALFQLFWHVR